MGVAELTDGVDESARMRAGVGARVLRIGRRAGGGLRRLTPAGVLALLCAGALSPVVVPGIVGTSVVAAVAAVGVMGSVGANVLTDVVLRAVRRSKERLDQEQFDQDKVEDELARTIEDVLLVGDAYASELRAGIAVLLRKIDGVGAAVEAAAASGDADLFAEVGKAMAALGVDFAEFRFVLADVSAATASIQDTLTRQDAEHRADRDQLDKLILETRLVRETVTAIERRTQGLTEREGDGPRWSDGPPYRGLLAFGQDHESVFYGRDLLTMKLVGRAAERLTAPGLVVVTGASGAGKSSLLLAGFVPAVARGLLVPGAELWPRVVMTPTRTPLDELAARLAALGAGETVAVRDSLAERPDQAPLLIRQAVLATAGEHGALRASRLVLVVDQFEEIFQDEQGARQREPFLTALCAAATVPVGPAGDPAALVVLGVRGDFWDRLGAMPELAELLDVAQFTVGPMLEADLRLAITGPAAAAGTELEPGLTEHVLDDLRSLTGSAAFEIGVLPLLSQAMLITWQHKEGNRLTLRGYGRSGGVAHAVTTSAEDSYAGLTEREQDVARSVFRRLTVVAADGQVNRRQASRQDLYDTAPDAPAMVDAVLAAFAGQRLVVLGDGVVEIAHDALVRAWPRLREWLADNRADRLAFGRLVATTARWAALDHDKALLPRGSELTALRRAVGRWDADPDSYPDLDVAPQARAFLAAATRTARRGDLVRRAVTVLLAGLLVAAGTFAVIAERNADSAREQHDLALSRQLVAQSGAVLATDPVVAQQLALAAWRLSPSPAARAAMINSLSTGARATLIAHKDGVNAVAFSPDGRLLVTAGVGSTVRFWDTTTRKPVGAPINGGAAEVEFSPDGRTLAVLADRSVLLWDMTTHRSVGTLTTDSGVNELAFSPDGQVLATASWDVVRLWDVVTRQQIGSLPEQRRGVNGVAFSPDGRTLATAGADHTVRLWDHATGQQIGSSLTDRAFDTCLLGVRTVAFDAAGGTLMAGCDGNTVFWDTTTRQHVGSPIYRRNMVFSPDGRALAITDGTSVGLMTAPTRQQIGGSMTGHAASVNDMAFSPDGRILATASADGTVRLWNSPALQRIGPAQDNPDSDILCAVFSPNGRMVATASDDGTVRLWDVATRQQIGSPFPGDVTDLHRIAFSPDSRIVATMNLTKTVRLWDTVTHEQIGEPITHEGVVHALAFSPDGRTLATAGEDPVRLWDTSTHRALGDPVTDIGNYDAVTFSPDGRTLAIAGGSVVELWTTANRQQIGSFEGHTRSVYSIAFSPDGKTLATAGEDGTLRLWDTRTRQQIGVPLTADDFRIHEVTFTPDGQTLATAATDNVSLWDVASHQRIGSPLNGRFSAAFSPDGRTLATIVDNTVWLQTGVRHENPADTICAQAGPPTQQIWARYSPGEPLPQLCP